MRPLITLLLFLLGVCVFSQSNKYLRFIYIDHEVSTDTKTLCENRGYLKTAWADADENYETEQLIIYLSTGRDEDNYALMAFKNIEEGNENETEDAFNKIIAALQSATRHTVLPEKDVDNIISLFSKYPFFDSDGKLALKGLTMDFFVGQDFWQREYNQKIIATLYTVLNLHAQEKSVNELTINIRFPKGEPINYSVEQPFGARNLQGINSSKNIRITKY